ncbi:MAG: hypothetical protein E7672_08785, partial [Ruminococcaceae bacterium]|nr:hypothetical protein [Oscillospiraceae bacterium]
MTRTRRKTMNNGADISVNEISYPIITMDEIADEIAECKSALILTHVNPDGDCIGSAFALAGIIEACGGTVKVVCPSPLPKRLMFLCGEVTDLVLPENEPVESYDRIISVDVASPMQLGDFSSLIPNISFMIDHHGMGEAFAKNYIDPSASAAGEIIFSLYEILRSRGVVGSVPEVARRIYAAIVSDTGSFKFSNTTPETHLIASRLVEEINGADDGGMDTADVCRSLFGQRTLKELTAQMLAIQNLRFYEDGRLGAVIFTQDMLAEAGLTEEEIGNVVDTPRGVEGVLVGISLRQLSS